MTSFQLAKNMWDKTEYTTVETDDIIEAVQNLIQEGNPRATERGTAAMYGGSCCYIKEAKRKSPYLFPYSMKEAGAKLVKENTDKFTMLVLDIDNGAKDGKCTIEEFIDIYQDFDYYLYSSVGHSCSLMDKFRVIIPLAKEMEVEELILRKAAILDMFSVGGYSFVDNSAINRCRGFVVPVNTWNFFEYTNRVGQKLDVEPMARLGRTKINYVRNRNTIPGIEKHPEVLALVDLYMEAGEDSLINVDGKEYTRNDAFYKIHIEIASYNIEEDAQKALALYMDYDGKRGETPALQTVENARAVCNKVAVAALGWNKKPSCGVTIVDRYISKDMVPMKLGGINLLTSPPGTGKTTIALGDDLPVIEGVTHKVLFAAPLNSIIHQQAAADPRIALLTGLKNSLPNCDRIVCSFNALVSILKSYKDLSGTLIVIDECHKLITDGYRADLMSQVIEYTVTRSDITSLYMSGTFEPEFLDCVPFDTHFAFGTNRPMRDVNVVEVDNVVHGTAQLLEKISGNSFVLLDNTKKGAAVAKALKIPHLHKDAKDTSTFKKILDKSKITTSVVTTQVILEGINLKDCVDNIVVVGKPDKWGVDQMVQFFERERVRVPRFFFVRTPIKERISRIKHAESEKAYQNMAFEHLKSQGLERLKDIGVVGVKELFREETQLGEDSVTMNIVYPYVQQKDEYNKAIFQDQDLMDEQLRKYGYRLINKTIEGVGKGDHSTVKAILDHEKEMAKEAYEALVIACIKGEEPEESEHNALFRTIQNLIYVQGWPVDKIEQTMHDSAKKMAIMGRLKYDRPHYEARIFASFNVGEFYTKEEVQARLVECLETSWAKDLRLRKNAYMQLLNRYFNTKYSRTKKLHKITEKIDIIRTERIAEI